MAFGPDRNFTQRPPMADINVVPLVDVMLVLLVIFIITAPLLTHSVKLDLPKASNTPTVSQSDHIEVSISSDGALYLDGVKLQRPQLTERFGVEAGRNPQPEIHLHADRLVRYEAVAQVISAAKNAGLTRIGFVTDPSDQLAETRADQTRTNAPRATK